MSPPLNAAKSWANQCDEPHNNHHSALRAAAVGSGVAGTCIVIFRVVSRLYTDQRLWWDDWSHIVAGV
ncbi:uncharacterized protein N7483_011357 [Penicillium malachiteum]|uniref:uncharacterized protein n=1 Tax=Penicillium malachiteum TaxID=1324776 RepID=UPI002547F7C8|nr:uncharacterized protein N7483_011357 [Penicillium malachiteum]KAJ5714176.1 hypothetical protein N7483_011357 [Penicillium malachiteum]